MIENETISFPTTCDGFIEVNLAQYILNRSTETDETNCDHWPCSNMYTRCDGFWNCMDGSDELNCSNWSSTCAANEFKCVSAETFELICLSAIHAGDGHVDCLGGSDERVYCRRQRPAATDERYRCWNSTECITVYRMCTNLEQCPFEDDKKFFE
ncbi:unnamed protein product [Rotaria sp. Silwood2]|nr:unnamed protein product [Rotaria sp. Silwood2]CAF4437934.1 unnamed protein product [Rotaria sp. Silwood2]